MLLSYVIPGYTFAILCIICACHINPRDQDKYRHVALTITSGLTGILCAIMLIFFA